MNELGLKRIQGIVHIENRASIRVLEKNGYLQEGALRHYPFGREFHDVAMLAIVKTETSIPVYRTNGNLKQSGRANG